LGTVPFYTGGFLNGSATSVVDNWDSPRAGLAKIEWHTHPG